MVVEEVMTADPITVDVSATVRDVLQAMFEGNVRHLPVIDDGDLVGIISDRDLRAFLNPDVVLGNDEAAERLGQAVSDLMSGDVISVTPGTELSEVADLMIDQKIGAIPVVRTDSQQLIGIVSYVDVLRVARDAL